MSNAALATGLLVPLVALGWSQPPQTPGQPRDSSQPRETQPTQPKDAPKKPGSMTMQEDATFRDALAAQEKRIWEAMKAGDWKTVEAMSSDRFVAVCPTGFESKSEAIEKGKAHKLTAYTLSEWRSIKLDNDTGLIMYKAECTGTPAEGGSDKFIAYHTTLWRRDGNNWLADMHQATKEEGAKR
jgi:ketosteroid isomerase-like protein